MLKIENVHFAYDKREILCSVNLEVKKGDYLALVGSNGSGKTTLMKLVLGFLKPQIGSVSIDTDRLGYVPQGGLIHVSSFPANVLEVVVMRLPKTNVFNATSKERVEKALNALDKVGMRDHAYEKISTLSGGQLQRVLIARELVVEPELILLDEPTMGLDQESVQHLFKVLNQLNVEGMTLMVVNHNLEEIRHYVTRVVQLHNQHLQEVV